MFDVLDELNTYSQMYCVVMIDCCYLELGAEREREDESAVVSELGMWQVGTT